MVNKSLSLKKKKKDLFLLNKNIIPQEYKTFIEGIPSVQKQTDIPRTVSDCDDEYDE